MKKILIIAVMAVICSNASAQLKLTEQFDNPPFTASGNLGTQNSWVQSGTGLDVQVSYRADNTGALIYPNYASGKTSVAITRYTGVNPGISPYKSFNTSIPMNTNGVVFLSFVIRVSIAQTGGEKCVAFQNTTGGYIGALYVRKSGANVQFAVSKGSTLSAYSANFSFNTTYLIIIRYDINAGSGTDDLSYLWVNPLITAVPNTASASASAAGGTDLNTANMSSLAIVQSGVNGCDAELDAFRVAYGTAQADNTANAAAAWDNLSPQGAPLPVKLGNIKAYEKQSGIQLEWTAYQEDNLSNYQVERSADGMKFYTIGNQAARNSAIETKYDFFDAVPMPGANFYRLKKIDNDGKYGYTNVVIINLDKSVKAITLYPNPVTTGTVSLQLTDLSKGNYSMKIMSANGQQVYAQRFSHGGGSINQSIQLPSGIRSGMYIVQMDNENMKVMSKAFMVQ